MFTFYYMHGVSYNHSPTVEKILIICTQMLNKYNLLQTSKVHFIESMMAKLSYSTTVGLSGLVLANMAGA